MWVGTHSYLCANGYFICAKLHAMQRLELMVAIQYVQVAGQRSDRIGQDRIYLLCNCAKVYCG